MKRSESSIQNSSLVNEAENDDEIFQALKPMIKNSIDGLFLLFKEDQELFNIILDKCKKVNNYDADIKKIITANEIRYFIMDYIGNTQENALKIVQSSQYLYDITDCISSYIAPVDELSCQYIDSYSKELLGNIAGDKIEEGF